MDMELMKNSFNTRIPGQEKMQTGMLDKDGYIWYGVVEDRKDPSWSLSCSYSWMPQKTKAEFQPIFTLFQVLMYFCSQLVWVNTSWTCGGNLGDGFLS